MCVIEQGKKLDVVQSEWENNLGQGQNVRPEELSLIKQLTLIILLCMFCKYKNIL